MSALTDLMSQAIQPLRKKFSQTVGDQVARRVDTQAATAAPRVFEEDALKLGGPPPQNLFQTIKATVEQLLPEDTSGLPHQRFMVRETTPNAGQLLQVDNDTHFGSAVPNLQVGEPLTIRGEIWHDPNGQSGIHWTHHANVQGDAGFIQTPDGQTYQ